MISVKRVLGLSAAAIVLATTPAGVTGCGGNAGGPPNADAAIAADQAAREKGLSGRERRRMRMEGDAALQDQQAQPEQPATK